MKYALFAAILAVAFPAQATPCVDYEKAQEALASIGEQPAQIGNVPGVAVIEIWVNKDTHAFTMIARPVDNPELACVILSGEGFRSATTRYIPGRNS